MRLFVLIACFGAIVAPKAARAQAGEQQPAGQKTGVQAGAVQAGAVQAGAVQASPEFRAEFVKLQAEADKLSEAADKAYQSAKTDAEREGVIERTLRTEITEGAAIADRANNLVKSSPKDIAVVEVLTWVLEKFPATPAATQAAEMLTKNHLKSRKSQFIASQYALAPMSWTEKLLRAFVTADLPDPQKTQAYLDLGLVLKSKAAMKAMLARLDGKRLSFMELRFGKAYLDSLRAADRNQLNDEAIQNLNTVVQREAGKSGSLLRDRANAAIKEIRAVRT